MNFVYCLFFKSNFVFIKTGNSDKIHHPGRDRDAGRDRTGKLSSRARRVREDKFQIRSQLRLAARHREPTSNPSFKIVQSPSSL